MPTIISISCAAEIEPKSRSLTEFAIVEISPGKREAHPDARQNERDDDLSERRRRADRGQDEQSARHRPIPTTAEKRSPSFTAT